MSDIAQGGPQPGGDLDRAGARRDRRPPSTCSTSSSRHAGASRLRRGRSLAAGVRRRYTARNLPPRPACQGRSRSVTATREDLRADPRRHRPAVGGLDGRPRGPRRRRARVHGRLRRARPSIRRRAARAPGVRRAARPALRDGARRVRRAPGAAAAGRLGRPRRGPRPRDRAQVRRPRDPAPDQPRRQGDGGLARPARRGARRRRRRWSPTSSRGASSRAASSPRRSTARTATRRRPCSTSWC